MKRAIQLLAALLTLQLLLALAFHYSGPNLSAHTVNTPLLTKGTGFIDRITVEAAGNTRVTLARVNGKWQLPDEHDFPADASKVGQLLSKLEGIKLGVPVATSADALERFKVAEKNFERRITLGGDGKKLDTLYFGTAQGAREVHARRANQKEVFAVDFTTYDVPAKTEDWEDKTVLQMPKTEIAGIEVGGLQLKSISAAKDDKRAANPVWQTDGLKAGETLKSEAADKLADLLANLRIDSVLSRENKAEYGLDKPVLQLTVADNGGKRIDYRIGKMADGKAYTLKASTRDEYFRLSTYTAEPLIGAAKRETLLGQATANGKSGK